MFNQNSFFRGHERKVRNEVKTNRNRNKQQFIGNLGIAVGSYLMMVSGFNIALFINC
jgi:hypothetical protein